MSVVAIVLTLFWYVVVGIGAGFLLREAEWGADEASAVGLMWPLVLLLLVCKAVAFVIARATVPGMGFKKVYRRIFPGRPLREFEPTDCDEKGPYR